MSMPAQFEKEFAAFPLTLRTLVYAELEAGNEVVAIGGGFPAPPIGANVRLAKPVSTRPRQSAGDVIFRERNSSLYSGEFTDATRVYYVLEPPLPPRPVRDAATASLAVQRFRESMTMKFERWHDGIGYDLEILKTATPEELSSIEEMLLSHGTVDWRDVEALAALDSLRAREAVQRAHQSSSHEIRLAVQRHAPALLTDTDRTAALAAALDDAELFGGLTQALLEVETFHPPDIMSALLRGLMERDGGTAVHFAAMLYFLHGKSAEAFDWDHRPFFLRFNTSDLLEREIVTRELCDTIGVDPVRCIRPTR